MLTKIKRTYVHRNIKLNSARSYKTQERLEFTLRGYNINYMPHIVVKNSAGKYTALFQEAEKYAQYTASEWQDKLNEVRECGFKVA